MKTLWFKQIYVQDILSGTKVDTIRKRSSRLPNVGDIVAFTVGPRPPFCNVRIISISPAEDLSDYRATQVRGIYGDTADTVRLTFALVPSQ
jgi:hypothetical protein